MTPRSFLTAFCMLLLGAGLFFAPRAVAEAVRGAICDVLRPGHEAVRLVRQSVSSPFPSLSGNAADASEREQLAVELETEKEQNRALQIRLAQLIEQQSSDAQISTDLTKSHRLVMPSLIEVAVVGDVMAEQWRSGKLLDWGAKNGVRENELVLATRPSKRPLIDLGQDGFISTEDRLLLGRCVIGKVEHVGRWTSTFQLVTDAQYRGRAQLIRKTSDGLFVFEAQGILKGQGQELCKLEGIPAEKSVHVHDAVYTADRDGLLPVPLYYGEVVEAELNPEDREWTVLVKPVELPSRLTTVQLLRTTINPERLAVK
jgi:cell shape-determining protein MreC